MSTPNQYSRRLFLQRAFLASLAASGAGSVLASCASGDGDSQNTNGAAKSAENPFGVKADAALDVVIFKGGYGDDYAKFHEELYTKKFSGAQVKHAGITDIRQQLQPRFNSGNPPDVIDNSGAEQLPLSTLADTGQLTDLTQLFDAESIDGGKVRDGLIPVALEAGEYGGKVLVLNYALEVYGLWYDKTLFDEKGWAPAETWEDFLALCEEIKGAGIAPMAHQGKYPYYIQQVMMDMAVKHGGPEVVFAIDSLEPNAWKHESVKMAAEALLEIKSKGYMLEGTEGLDHIQSQTRWNEGKAAFIPSGSWLENEQKEVAPEGFATTVAPTPLLDGATLPFQSTRVSAAEAFIVPAKAKNVEGGLEYLRIMLSKEGASKFTELTASPTVVQGAGEGLELTPAAASASELVEAGGDSNWNYYYFNWYSPMKPKVETAFGELAAGRITADEFCSAAQKAADETADDPQTQKRERS
ncbi:MAG: N-acetylglucosamine/diacetylchitobiose ABC transporter substrate-binding protein [Pseudonocardiaceae bacterium]